MTQNITTYYIPQNINISKGKIYDLYYSKVTNLDLSSITNPQNLTINGILQPNKQVITETTQSSTSQITMSPEEYTELLSLADTTTKLYNQSQRLIKKLTKERN